MYSMYGHHLLITDSESNIDQPREVAKPARGQLNREIKCPCRCIRGKYILYYCLHLFCSSYCLHYCTPAASRPGWTQTVEVTEETVRSPGVL